MTDPTWISLLPPLLAITLAIVSRQVYLSLAGGVWLGWTILEGWNPLTGLASAIDGSVAVLSNPGDAKVILFTLVIGSLIATVESSGGVKGFVSFLESRHWVDTPRKARLLAWTIGLTLFIESNINVLVAGSVSRPLFDRFKVSREKLAYIIDSASAPTCIMIPLNAWGAYNLGILSGLGLEDPLRVFLSAVVLNFYAIAALLLALVAAITGFNIGPMKKAEARTQGGEVLWPNATPMIDEAILSPQPNDKIPPRAVNMVLPIVVLVVMMPVFLFVTGGGDLMEGEGSTSVLWAVMAGCQWLGSFFSFRGGRRWMS